MKLDALIQKIGATARFGKKKGDALAPPQLSDATRVPYGPFRFKTLLAKGTAYEVEVSTDLKNWVAISAEIARGEELEYIDSEAFKHSYRFYRLLVGDIASLNVIGYVSLTLPPGFSMIANPLEGGVNHVGEIFKGWPDGTTLHRFDTRIFRLTENEIKSGVWAHPNEKLVPGEGAIFFNPTADYKSASFAGNVMQGHLSIPIPAGFSVRSSLVPQPGSLEDLGFPVTNGDVIHLFDRDRQKYVLHPYEDGKWSHGAPLVSIGESFWVAKTAPGNWNRDLIISS